MLFYRETDSLCEGLETLEVVKKEIEHHQGKEMLVCGLEGIKGYIRPNTPLSCFPEVSRVAITFSKTQSEQKAWDPVFGDENQSSADCVIFYIRAVGKRKKRIVKCRELDREGNILCVYGFKGQTIRDTLKKDGRFLPFVENDNWKLITDKGYIIENTQLINRLSDQLFQIEVEIRKRPKATGASQNSKLEATDFTKLRKAIVEKYLRLKRECENIKWNIKEETEKRRSLFISHRRAFRKLTKKSIPSIQLKFLSQFSESVGYISWNAHNKSRGATCFVFREQYIITCWHVLNDIVGLDREPREHTNLISQCVKVTFHYEDSQELGHFFLVEPWLEIGDKALDYAVLRLKDNEQQVPPGLYNGIATGHPRDLVYMIGHPDGKARTIDACTVVPQSLQRRENQECVLGRREAVVGTDPEQSILMYTQRSFQKTTRNSNVNSSNTFYCGSSGSPVFDHKGSLVAMHTFGFDFEYEDGASNIIEFGVRLESILADMKQKYEMWYNKVCVHQQDVEMSSLEY